MGRCRVDWYDDDVFSVMSSIPTLRGRGEGRGPTTEYRNNQSDTFRITIQPEYVLESRDKKDNCGEDLKVCRVIMCLCVALC